MGYSNSNVGYSNWNDGWRSEVRPGRHWADEMNLFAVIALYTVGIMMIPFMMLDGYVQEHKEEWKANIKDRLKCLDRGFWVSSAIGAVAFLLFLIALLASR